MKQDAEKILLAARSLLQGSEGIIDKTPILETMLKMGDFTLNRWWLVMQASIAGAYLFKENIDINKLEFENEKLKTILNRYLLFMHEAPEQTDVKVSVSDTFGFWFMDALLNRALTLDEGRQTIRPIGLYIDMMSDKVKLVKYK